MALLVLGPSLFSVALGRAQTAPAAAPSAAPPEAPSAPPVSATSQCVEGPGAPPSDPTKITRASSGKQSAEVSNFVDPESSPPRTFLELAAFMGAQVRTDDPPTLPVAARVGPVVGGGAFLWPTRVIGFGLGYTYADLGRIQSEKATPSVVVDYSAHSLLAEARVAPFRFASALIFASVGGGFVWQNASLRATFPPLDGQPSSTFQCDVGSNLEFGFRAGVGVKAQIASSLAFVGEASFQGYRFTSDVLTGCAPGAGTAQTVMARFGLAYDINVASVVR